LHLRGGGRVSVQNDDTCRDIFLTSPQTGLGQVVGWQFPNSRMSEYFGPLMRSSRAREQRANERFLPLSRERSFRWFHEALVFETSLRPLPPLMFVGFSHRFLPFASNAGISKVLSGASFVVCSNFLSSARHYSASPFGPGQASTSDWAWNTGHGGWWVGIPLSV